MQGFFLFLKTFSGKQVLSVFLILFAVIDVLGNLAVIIKVRHQTGQVRARSTTTAVGLIMTLFLFFGPFILDIFRVDVGSFSVAGGIILAVLGLEMVLNISIVKLDAHPETSSVVPLAFPLLAGTGTLTTLLTLKAEYQDINILVGILANMLVIYVVLRSSGWIEKSLGKLGITLLRKMMGIVLLSMAIKLFKAHLFVSG